MAGGGQTIALALLCAAGGACQLLNEIDVCGRAAPAPTTVNRVYTDDQRIQTPAALARLPTGDAYLVYTSTHRSQDGKETDASLHGTRVDHAATWAKDCDIDQERILADTIPGDGISQFRGFGGVAPPDEVGQGGLIVYVEQDDFAPPRVMGLFMTSAGCIDPRRAPVEIGPPTPNVDVGRPSAVRILRADTRDEFAVTWPEVTAAGTRVAARLVIDLVAGVIFPPTAGDPTGGVVRIEVANAPITSSIVRLSESRLGLLSQGAGRGAVTMQVLDTSLRPVDAALLLAAPARSPMTPDANVLAATSGDLTLVSWVEPDPADRNRVMALLLDEKLGFVVGPSGPVRAFRVGSAAAGVEALKGLTTLPDGRFFLAWQQLAAAGETDPLPGGTLRAAIVGRDGAIAFVNPACGERDFPLAGRAAGNQGSASVTSLADGTVLGAWTDGSGTGPDQDGTSIRGVAWRSHDLLP